MESKKISLDRLMDFIKTLTPSDKIFFYMRSKGKYNMEYIIKIKK